MKICTFFGGNKFRFSLYSYGISFFRKFLAVRRNSGRRYKRIILKKRKREQGLTNKEENALRVEKIVCRGRKRKIVISETPPQCDF